MIALLTPTRQRHLKRKRFHDSVIDLSDSKENIFCYYYIDNDDPEIDSYSSQQLYNAVDTIGEPMSVSKSWNVLAEKAIADGAEILIMGNDDLVYLSSGWDTELQKSVESFKDKIYCAWFEDKINGKNHCAFPIVSKEWYNCLGYFTPGVFNFGYNDTWIFDIAKKIDRCLFISTVQTEHKHFTQKKAEYDETYARNRTQENGNLYLKDKIIFDNTENIRLQDAEKLRSLI